ncbi:MAG TPA: VanZ family protein [Verrucomicrobiae bacterium]|nr:VanZ family protein [Verrucomicrobiae bacterium]
MADCPDGAPEEVGARKSTGSLAVRSFCSRWLPVALWMIAIFALSGMPSRRLPNLGIPYVDKIAHACAYAAGGLLSARAAQHATAAFLIPAAFGASDEWHQQSVPGRNSDIADWAADCIGALVGVVIYRLFRRARLTSPQR